MTQPEQFMQDKSMMPEAQSSNYGKNISPSAKAVLRATQKFEEGEGIDLFQEDPDIEKVRHMVSSYKGSLYSAITQRLDEVFRLGGVTIVTQRDMMALLERLWVSNISKLSRTELRVLEAALEVPKFSLRSLASKAKLSYAQTRRAFQRIKQSGVLKTAGLLEANKLGLERILVKLEAPNLVISCPYIEKILFVDGSSPLVFLTLTIPRNRVGELLNVVRNLRADSSSATAWRLSKGRPRFSSLYFNSKKGSWMVDYFHFQLLLRAGGRSLTVGKTTNSSPVAAIKFTESELRVIDELLDDYERTAIEIAHSANLSQSTAFRKRSRILDEGIVVPRSKIIIPQLSDRVLSILGPESAGDIMPAWNRLPLSYISQISNLENPSERKILLLSALPAGSAPILLEVLKNERSRADDMLTLPVAAGLIGRVSIASLFDSKSKSWKWDPSFFDLRSYGTLRREAANLDIPLDLA